MNKLKQTMRKKLSIIIDNLWFNKKPEADIIITDEKITGYIMQFFMEKELQIRIKRRGVLYDPILSNYLNVNVFYFSHNRMKYIVENINKIYKKHIHSNPYYLKLHIKDEVFIIAHKMANAINKGLFDYCYYIQERVFFESPNISDIDMWFKLILFEMYS
jgi:hypothetical protein